MGKKSKKLVNEFYSSLGHRHTIPMSDDSKATIAALEAKIVVLETQVEFLKLNCKLDTASVNKALADLATPQVPSINYSINLT